MIRPASSTRIRSQCRAVDTRWENDYGGLAPPQPAQVLENALLGFGIDAGETVVEQQHRRVADQPPSQSGALHLAAGERDAAFSDHGVHAVGKSFDGLLQVGGLGRGPDRIDLAARVVVGEIVAQCLAEQERNLGHQRRLRPELCEGIVADVLPIQEDLPRRGVEQAHELPQQRRLAGAHPAHDGDGLAAADGQADAVERQWQTVAIAEAQVPGLEDAPDPGRRIRPGTVLDFGFQAQHLEQAVAGHRRPLKQVDHEAGDAKRLHNHVHVHQEGDQRTRRHLAAQHEITAKPDDGDGAQRGQARHPGHHQGIDAGLAVEGVRVSLAGPGEAGDLVVFLGHGLDGADAGQVLLHLCAEIGQAVLHVL